MARRDRIRDFSGEARVIRERAILAGLFCTVIIVVLLARLFLLQKVNHEHYLTLSTKNRVRLMAIAPTRGQIFDRNGVILAQNLPSYRLEITAEEVTSMEETLQQLQQYVSLSERDIKRFKKLNRRKRASEGVPVRFNMSDQEVARFSVHRHLFPGVEVVVRLNRSYPLKELAVHTVGYVGRINEREAKVLNRARYRSTTHTGKTGIEKYYENLLHGQVGFRQVEVNVQGRVVQELDKKAPLPGKNLYLTLNSGLQAAAEKALAGYSGAAAVVDVRTGEVLALVSKPTYDPNLFVNGISQKNYDLLRNNDERPLFNRSVSGQYPPGSTIKPMMGVIGLEEGVVSAHDRVFCSGVYRLPNEARRYRDWKRSGHGLVDLEQSIAQSCDVYFYDLALKLGIDRLSPFMQRFGFGHRTGIDVPGEASGIMPSRAWKKRHRKQSWYPGETIITGIGQGYMTATPLQLAVATSVIASKGRRVQPHLLMGSQDILGGEVKLSSSQLLTPLNDIKAQTWQAVIHSMESVMYAPRGTGRRSALNASYRIAGKTGTAQVYSLGQDEKYDAKTLAYKLRDHALFVAFAPIKNPKIALAVIAEHGGGGGSVAAPIARKILDYYLDERADSSAKEQ
ncbi:MAG: penicillin-binding protein 2 [Gammaproteobacteria bacterium]|nr:penicillin-binding protein 2 [Gammaproteobacteria bacterium]